MSVLEARLKRVVRPKVRLWTTIQLVDRLIEKDFTQVKRALLLSSEAERLAASISDPRGIAAALRCAGSCQFLLSNFAVALETFKRALPLAERTGDAECEILILLDMGHLYIGQSRHDLALEALAKCAKLSELVENIPLQASALSRMGTLLNNLGKYPEALECYKKSLTLFDRTQLTRGRVVTLLHMGDSLSFLGRYEEALSTLEQARQLCRTRRDDRTEGLCQVNIGAIYDEIGDYPNALSFFLASAKTLERVGDKLNLAITYGNLMQVYLELGNIDKAANFGEEALAVFEEIGYKYGQTAMYKIFGDYYLRRGQRAHAKRFQKRSLALSREIGSKDYETTALIALAKMESDLGKFIAAEKLFRAALMVATGNPHHTTAVLLGLGALFNKQSRPDQALPFLERAITIAGEIHSRPYEQEVHELMAETLEMKGDFKAALIHWKFASSIKEEMLGPEKQKAIAEIRIRSSIENAESEKAALRKETKLKSIEVERMAIDLTEKTELIRNTSRRMKEIVKRLPTKDSGTRSQLEGVLSDLGHSLGNKRAIANEFQLVYRNTLQKLSKKYPDLSPTERKICVLLHDGLSTKQVADMMKISIRTVDWYRNKIRKRMNLEPWASITSTLARM